MNLVAYIDSSAHPNAKSYYRMFPYEPIPKIKDAQVRPTIPIPNMTVESLLKKILMRRKKNILIVAHGTTDGLSLPIVKSSDIRLQLKAEDPGAPPLTSTVPGALKILLDNQNQKLSDADAAKKLYMKPNAFTKLKELIKNVQTMKLNHVELRSCNTGKNPAALKALKEFFGASSLCAPTEADVYISLNFGKPTKNKDDWNAWVKENHKPIIEGAPPNRFAYALPILRSNLNVLAESRKAVLVWIKKHFPRGKYKGGDMPCHYFAYGNKAVFPKDPGYLRLIKCI